MISFDMEQTSDEWFDVRRGVPTSSCFNRIMTSKGMKLAAGATSYMHQLIAEAARKGEPADESFSTPAIEHGVKTEPEAADYYAAFCTSEPVYEIGFTKTDDGRFGGSPDRMVGDDGVLEIKCPQPVTHVGWLDRGGIPDKHLAQVHGHMITTGRDWCDWLSYCPPFPELLVRAVADDYTARLMEVLDEFHLAFEKMKAKACFSELLTTITNSARL